MTPPEPWWRARARPCRRSRTSGRSHVRSATTPGGSRPFRRRSGLAVRGERIERGAGGGDGMELWLDYLKTFGWGVVGAVTMAVSLWILVRVFTWLTPVDEWEEVKKGNLGIAIIMAAVIIGFALVVSSMVAPPPAVK